MIAPDHSRLSIVRQCALVSIARSSHYGSSVEFVGELWLG